MILAKTDGVLSRCFSGTWSQLILTVILNVTETTISPLCTWGNRQGDVRWFAEVTQLVAEHGFEPRQFGCRTQALNQPHCTASLCFSCALRSERPGISWQLGTLRPEALMPTVAKLSGDRVGQETSPRSSPTLGDIPMPSECSLWIPETFWALSPWMESLRWAAVWESLWETGGQEWAYVSGCF